MKLVTSVNEIETFNVEDETEFTVESNVHMMKILSGLYSDIPWALVREYGTNMLDAYNFFVPANGVVRPPEIHLPTYLEPWIEFRDFGKGMPFDMVKRVYTGYGKSTKNDNNTDVGGLGLGAKSAFCYTDGDSWGVESRHDGQTHHFAFYKNSRGFPATAHLGTDETPDVESGVTVRIPVKPEHFRAFTDATKKLARYFPMPLKIVSDENVIPDAKPDYKFTGTNWSLALERQTWTVVMGNIPYPIDTNYFERLTSWDLAVQFSLHFTAPIGSLEFTPDRESLQYDDRTIKALREMEKQFFAEISAQLQTEVDKCRCEWDALVFAMSLKSISQLRPMLALNFAGNEDVMKKMYVERKRTDVTSLYIVSRKARINRDDPHITQDDKGINTLHPVVMHLSIGNLMTTRVIVTGAKPKTKEYELLVKKARLWIETEYIRRNYSDRREARVDSAAMHIISAPGKTVKDIMVELGGFPSVITEADIPEVVEEKIERKTYTRTKTELKVLLAGEWANDSNVVVEDGGWYVPLERNQPMDNQLIRTTSGLNELVRAAKAAGIIPEDTIVYGIPRTHKHVENKPGWVQFLPALKESVEQGIAAVAQNIVDGADWTNRKWRMDAINNVIKCAKDFPTVPEFAEVLRLEGLVVASKAWTLLARDLMIDIPNTKVTPFADVVKPIQSKYPMLWIILENYNGYSDDDKKVVLDYITLVG